MTRLSARRTLAGSLIVAVIATPGVTRAQTPGPDVAPEHLKHLTQAVRIIKREYVDPVDDTRLAEGCLARMVAAPQLSGARPPADLTQIPLLLRRVVTQAGNGPIPALVTACLQGLVAVLDRHSRYVDFEARRAASTAGDTAAVGIELANVEGAVVIVLVADGSPAATAGIHTGDHLTMIDGEPLDGVPLEDVIRRLRGRPGSPVTLTLMRRNDIRTFTVTRGTFEARSVLAKSLEPGVLHLRLTRFIDRTPDEMERALRPIFDTPSTLPRAIVLDLRANAGGPLRAATEVAGLFVPDGTALGSIDGRSPTAKRKFVSEAKRWAREPTFDRLRTAPLIVLVNGVTASGGEMVAAALQANGRGRIVGAPTAGIGTIQTLFPLDGPLAQLSLTTSRWLTPKGDRIEGHPLVPDVSLLTARGPVIVAPGERDLDVERAVEVLLKRDRR